MHLQLLFNFSWSNGYSNLLSGLWRLRQESPELVCQPMNALVFKEHFFFFFLLCHSNCNLCPAQVHVVLKPPAAGMGSFHVCSNDFTSYWHPCYWYMILLVIGRSGLLLLLLIWLYLKSRVITLALHNYITKQKFI